MPGERLADAVAGVTDLPASMVDVREGVGLALFEPAEPVLQPGDQASGVGVAEVPSGELHAGAGRAVEADGPGGPADAGGQREAGEMTRPQLARAQAFQGGQLSLQQLLQVLPGIASAGMETLVDGHGELVASGVLAAGDGRIDAGGQRGQGGDVLLVAGDGVAQRVLVAVVGALGTLQAG